MKIYGNRPPEGQDVYLRTEKTQGKDAIEKVQQTEKLSKAKGRDRVELSDKAKEVESIKKAIEALPDVRTERVEAIKKAIETGTYRIEPEKIVNKLFEEL
ncbi:MAG: flagellar biosynthesis anti-sigma factor FlgM [Nitrospirae bacterium]|nr:flagellar biosynthesis anti-sigma factor FlgM [Nitrospirota bacterium]